MEEDNEEIARIHPLLDSNSLLHYSVDLTPCDSSAPNLWYGVARRWKLLLILA
jgi:hypothetical protein